MIMENLKKTNMDFMWCLHCERAYKRGSFRKGGMCPYKGCDGHTLVDGWDWTQIREANPQYPEIPEMGKVYSLYS